MTEWARVDAYLLGVAHSEVDELRTSGYRGTDREGARVPSPPAGADWSAAALGAGTQTVRWDPESGDWAVGKTLAEVNLRAETGALIIAVRRNGRHVTSPSADLTLSLGDILYLVGDESDIMLARRHLAGVAS